MSSSQTIRFRTNRLNIWYISRLEPRLHSTFRTGDSWQCEHQRGRPSFVNLRTIRRRLPDAVGALTSWQAIFDTANLQAGERILITGASGGVGSMAAQLAKAKGAFVIAMASGKNEEFVRSLGA